MDHPEKERLLKTLISLDVFSPLNRNDIETRLPFFGKVLLPLIDYLTLWDLVRLAGHSEDYPLIAILICMFDTLQEGSLCLDLEKNNLHRRLQAFADEAVSSDAAEKFLSNLDRHRYDGFVSRNCDQFRPLVLSESDGRRLLYFQKYYVFERQLKNRIEQFLSLSDSFAQTGMENISVDKLVREIYSPELTLRASKDGNPIAMDPFQIQAIKLVLFSGFSIISGGPGTGKTSLMVNMLRCMVRTGIDPASIVLCAPTGRAAQRMTEAIQYNIKTIRSPGDIDLDLLQLKAATLHKTLHYSYYLNDFYFREQNPMPASVVVLDEVSMVDVAMMEKFLRAVTPGKTRVILLGDKDQLPSVEAGAVFGTMIPHRREVKTFQHHLVVLKNNYRSGYRLQNLAKQINSGNITPIEPVSFQEALTLENDDWALVIPKTTEQWREDLISWVDFHLISDGTYPFLISAAGSMNPDDLMNTPEGREILEKIFRNMESSKILTLIKEGIWGNTGINSFLTGYLIDRLKAVENRLKAGIFSGALVIILRNDYSKNLFNGDTGVVIQDPRGIFRAYFKRFDSYVGFSIDMLPAWEPAYALTVHKCQGSEYDDILVVLPAEEEHRLLTRQLIYTAVTRAKGRVIIYGQSSAFQNALQRKIVRESGLSW